MAKMIDQLPDYIGEQMVWHAFSDNLPNHFIVYNSRTIQGDEYDFCILVENMGIFIVEVKGWFPENVINVVSPKSIYIEGYSKALGSPLNQARSYMFNMINHLQDDMGINPLLMSMVCYPRISKEEYYKKRLNIVSDEIETIFAEDLQNPQMLLSKFKTKYKNDVVKHADVLDHKMYMLVRHDFEPNFDLKEKAEELNPSYSRLRIIVNSLSAEQIQEIKDEYFTGIKEIVFFNDRDNYEELIKSVDEEFRQRNLKAERGNIVIGTNSLNISSRSEYSIFNLSAYYIENLAEYSPQNELVEEGQLSETQKAILQKVSEVCTFNYQQFLIEHADTDKDILVTAGAGTGKTYSMVSRVAYLCNKVADPIVDISKDLAMITFTNDAADNMKDRLKQMFMNYFTLTNKEKYLHLIDEMNQIQISTIHKFAFEILRKSCITFGIGNDFEISSETYKRRSIYQQKLNEYIARKIDADPYFINQLPLKVYELEDILLTFTAQLYNKSIDVKKITEENLGTPIEIMPFFNELIMECVVPAEEEYYQLLLDANKIDLQQAMILLNGLVNDSSFENHGLEFRYVFVDEFQDTDDVQIDSVIGLQKLFGKNCRLFVVGDLKQSIYRFRGATLSAFDKIKNNHRTWIELPLMRNYRTDGRLLDKFHPVFADMGNMGLLPYGTADRLSSNIQTDCPSDKLIIKIESDIKKPDLYYEDLFRAIKQQYDYLVEKNKEVKLSDKENTIAILVRYNYQTETIVREAKKRDIYVEVKEGGDLYRLQSTFDIHILTMAILHSKDPIYLANLIRSNYVNIRPDMHLLRGLSQSEKQKQLTEILDEYFMLRLGKKWEKLVSEFATRPVLVVLREIYEHTQPWKSFRISDSVAQNSYRTNYELLLENLVNRYSRDYLTLNMVNEFLKLNITTYQEAQSRTVNEDSGGIRIICQTVHKSKGLEYGTVVLPFTEEIISRLHYSTVGVDVVGEKIQYVIKIGQKYYHNENFNEDDEVVDQMREESRILYVAMTRAIRNIIWMDDVSDNKNLNWAKLLEVTGS